MIALCLESLEPRQKLLVAADLIRQGNEKAAAELAYDAADELEVRGLT
jgi:hypothetical protein